MVIALPCCTAQNTYYVKPSPDTPCHEDPCQTFSEYVSEAEQYFTYNTTIVFLPGEHVLQRDVILRNLVRSVLQHSYSSLTQIVCINNTFTFENLSSVEITGLCFVSCRLHLNNSCAVFQGTQLKDGMADFGGAVCVQNSTITFEGETTFDGNSAAVSGGGIFANVSNLIFHGSTTFINNEALERGAGLCVYFRAI